MDKKLITVFTFGILAVSISNLLLSVGVVSYLLLMSQGTSSVSRDSGDFPSFMSSSDGSIPATGINSMITDIDGGTNESGANATVSPTPQANVTTIAETPATGQASYDTGMTPPGPGQFPAGAGQTRPSGQMPSSGQVQGSQQTASSGQASSGNQTPETLQSLQDMTQAGTGTSSQGSLDLSSFMGSFGRTTTPTPRPALASTAWVSNLTSMLNSQYAANAQS